MYKLQGQITREFLGLRMRKFQGVVFNDPKHIRTFSSLH